MIGKPVGYTKVKFSSKADGLAASSLENSCGPGKKKKKQLISQSRQHSEFRMMEDPLNK